MSLKLRRREPCATSCLRPMASSTWLGSSEPLVQALPEEPHTPSRSSIRSSDSPSMPSKQKLTLPGSRFSRSPLRRLRSIFKISVDQLVPHAAQLRVFLIHRRDRVLHCNAEADDAGDVFRTGAARSLLCAAVDEVRIVTPRRMYSAPTPFGAWSLWPLRESMSMFCAP